MSNAEKGDFTLMTEGKEVEFAKRFEQIINTNSSICLVIAGSLGFSQEVIDRANYRFCLSKLTFTHQMTRAIVLEQVYRAFKINNKETYHK